MALPAPLNLRMAEHMMAEVLTKSMEARKMGLSLKHVSYGGELLNQVMSTSKKMEALHEKLQNLVSQDAKDDSKYSKLNAIADAQLKWWDKAKAW